MTTAISLTPAGLIEQETSFKNSQTFDFLKQRLERQFAVAKGSDDGLTERDASLSLSLLSEAPYRSAYWTVAPSDSTMLSLCPDISVEYPDGRKIALSLHAAETFNLGRAFRSAVKELEALTSEDGAVVVVNKLHSDHLQGRFIVDWDRRSFIPVF